MVGNWATVEDPDPVLLLSTVMPDAYERRIHSLVAYHMMVCKPQKLILFVSSFFFPLGFTFLLLNFIKP